MIYVISAINIQPSVLFCNTGRNLLKRVLGHVIIRYSIDGKYFFLARY